MQLQVLYQSLRKKWSFRRKLSIAIQGVDFCAQVLGSSLQSLVVNFCLSRWFLYAHILSTIFSCWSCYRAGFGISMYEFGSKKVLLEDFASVALTDSSVSVVNGYLQSINLHLVIDPFFASVPLFFLDRIILKILKWCILRMP